MEITGSMSVCDGSYILDSGKLKMSFVVSGGGARLASMIGPGGREWLSDSDSCAPLWKVAFEGPDGAKLEADSADVVLCSASSERENGTLSLTWRVSGPEDIIGHVVLDGRCGKGDAISHWALQVRLAEGWKVTRADFPVVPSINIVPELKMAVPAGWGLEYDVKSDTRYSATYPSCLCVMQFVALYSGGSGLYIGAHDAQANHKLFDAKAAEGCMTFTCTNWPGIPEEAGGTYRVPFEAAIGFFEGDYYSAAQIYREFSYETPWGAAGPISKRSIAEWVTDTDLWLKPSWDPIENVEACRKAGEFFDVPTSLHWYRWHQIPYDTLYPDYFPAKPGFAEGVKALQELGFHVMPYINGRLCDPNSQEWREEGAGDYAAIQENGEPYTEIYGSKVPHNAMCPHTSYWQDKIVGLVDRLIGECGVNGVYIDQIGAAHAYRCYNPNHGHPIGGGHFWFDGYRKLLDKARRGLPKDRMLTTEENIECWIDQFDALLLVNTPTNENSVIPLFPAVYSGRTITFGSLYIVPDDFERSLPFRAKMARAFVWGSQLGWVSVDAVMAPEAAKDAELLKNLARCRRHGHDYLLYGRFLGMLDVGGDNPRLTGEGTGSFGGTYRIDLPAVLGSAWLAEDGSLGVALANMSDEARDVEVTLPLQVAGIAEGRALSVSALGPGGQMSSWESASAVQNVRVYGRDALILSISVR